MDSEQTSRIEIDLSDIDQTWVDGHGDAFSISPTQWDTMNISSTASVTAPYTITSGPTYTAPQWNFSDLSITQQPSAKISLTGDDADIEINGESVVGMLREIRDRLNILQVSEEMEQEWDELRILREQYEAKLAECREKSIIWKALKHEN
jgi:hypothetical protein